MFARFRITGDRREAEAVLADKREPTFHGR